MEKEEICFELDEMKKAGIGGIEIQILYPLEEENQANHPIEYCSPEFFSILDFTLTEAEKREMGVDFALGSGWPWGTRLEPIEIPDGDWRLYLFVIAPYRQRVSRPTRGMEGTVIDHCRKDAAKLFFESVAAPILEKAGKGRIRAFFCDSLELTGNNFSSLILEEFEKRRGYDFTKALPAMWGDMGELTPHFRYDYFQTFSELTLENFFSYFSEWSHRHGVQTRLQAHGTWADILKAYASADIPEGETFGPADHYFVNTIHRRLAVSAAMVYEKPLVSNESFTWLRSPRFLETPEMLKRAVDSIFCDGINRIVNHGYAYSPRRKKQEPWTFYASSLLSHVNPWWEFYQHIAAYISRVCALMQTGSPVSETAIYIPQADIRADAPASELHMCLKIQEYVGERLVNALQQAGFWITYLNDDVLQKADWTPEGMKIGENVYRTILLSGCHRMPPETAKTLVRFTENGGLLIAIGSIPSDSCGYLNYKERGQTVRNAMEKLFPQKGWNAIGKGHSVFSEANAEQLISLITRKREPDFYAGEHRADIGFIHRRHEKEDIYFVSNISETEKTGPLYFQCTKPGVTVMDAVTGKLVPIRDIQQQKNHTKITFSMAPNDSCFVVFSETGCLQKPEITPTLRKVKPLSSWRFETPHTKAPVCMETPITWETIEGLEFYTGKGTYTVAFSLEECPVSATFLSFQNICCAASVECNGMPLGELWKRPWIIEIPLEYLKTGINLLKVTVSGVLFNAIYRNAESGLEETTLEGWPYFSEIMNRSRRELLFAIPEREKNLGLQPMGISGDVYLLENPENPSCIVFEK